MPARNKQNTTQHSRAEPGIVLWVPWWLGILSHVLVLGWGAYVVKRFMDRGLFEPRFDVIHEAYFFIFQTFPLILIGVGILGCLLGCFHTRILGRMAWWTTHGSGIMLAVALMFLRYHMTEVEPQQMVLREVEIVSAKVDRPLTILHISDLQSAGIGDYEQRVFQQIQSLQPDLVIHSGDWLQPIAPQTFESEFPKLMRLMEGINPPLGIFAVYGDTDGFWYHLDSDKLGELRMMGTRPYLIEWEGGQIALRGLGLYQSRYADMAREPVEQWVGTIPDDALSILVGHSPDYVLSTHDLPIDLCLAGHTHGGQVRIPFLGPLIIDSNVPLDWSRGFRRVGATRLNVSAGLGSTHASGLPSIRLFCPTEMTRITVSPESTP